MLASLLLLAGLSTSTPAMPVAKHEEESEPIEPMMLKMTCHPREELIAQIKENNGAVPMFVAMGSKQGMAIEFWRDTIHKGDNWVSFITRSDGISCIVMQGQTYGLADPDAKPTISPKDSM